MNEELKADVAKKINQLKQEGASEEELKKSVADLIKQAQIAGTADGALKYSQAALNVANAIRACSTDN